MKHLMMEKITAQNGSLCNNELRSTYVWGGDDKSNNYVLKPTLKNPCLSVTKSNFGLKIMGNIVV